MFSFVTSLELKKKKSISAIDITMTSYVRCRVYYQFVLDQMEEGGSSCSSNAAFEHKVEEQWQWHALYC